MRMTTAAAHRQFWTGLMIVGSLSIVSTVVPSRVLAAEIQVTNNSKTWKVETKDPKLEIHITQNGRLVTLSDGDRRQITFDTQTQRLRLGAEQDVEVSLYERRPFYFRRGDQIIASIQRVLPPTAQARTSTRPMPVNPNVTKRTVPAVQKLYTITREGQLMQMEIRGRSVQVTELSQLGVPFRTRGVLTEGLAMSPDGKLYAALNVGIEFTQKATKTGQDGQDGGSLLYRIDPQTGESTKVGSIGRKQIDGLTFTPGGTLYGVTSILGGGKHASLIRIDTHTGDSQTAILSLPLEDLDCITMISSEEALVVDGMGLKDAFYQIRLDGRSGLRRLAPTPNIIHNSRDLEGLALGNEDGFLYAFTGPDARPDGRVHLLQIDRRTFKHTDLGLMKFGGYCLAAEPLSRPDGETLQRLREDARRSSSRGNREK